MGELVDLLLDLLANGGNCIGMFDLLIGGSLGLGCRRIGWLAVLIATRGVAGLVLGILLHRLVRLLDLLANRGSRIGGSSGCVGRRSIVVLVGSAIAFNGSFVVACTGLVGLLIAGFGGLGLGLGRLGHVVSQNDGHRSQRPDVTAIKVTAHQKRRNASPNLSGKKKIRVREFLRERPSRACTVLYMSTIAIGTWAPVKQQYFNPGASKKKMRPGARMRPGRILCFPLNHTT